MLYTHDEGVFGLCGVIALICCTRLTRFVSSAHWQDVTETTGGNGFNEDRPHKTGDQLNHPEEDCHNNFWYAVDTEAQKRPFCNAIKRLVIPLGWV